MKKSKPGPRKSRSAKPDAATGLQWTSSAQRDLLRLYAFLEPKNARAARVAVRRILDQVGALMEHPLLGEPLDTYVPRDVRRLIIGDYELRYEVAAGAVYVLRLWHTREDRPW